VAVLLWLWAVVAGLLWGPQLSRLHYPDFGVREDATRILRSAGVLAYPVLDRGRSHRSPETAARCRRLLAGRDRAEIEARAWWLLVSPWELDLLATWLDVVVVKRFWSLLHDTGLGEFAYWPFDTESQEYFEMILHQYRRDVRSQR